MRRMCVHVERASYRANRPTNQPTSQSASQRPVDQVNFIEWTLLGGRWSFNPVG